MRQAMGTLVGETIIFAAGAGGFMIKYPHEVCFVCFY